MQPKDLKSAFGKRVRTLRRLRNLTQEELAESIECSTEHVSHIERGLASPSFEMIGRLASALKVKVSDLFDFSEQMDTRPTKK